MGRLHAPPRVMGLVYLHQGPGCSFLHSCLTRTSELGDPYSSPTSTFRIWSDCVQIACTLHLRIGSYNPNMHLHTIRTVDAVTSYPDSLCQTFDFSGGWRLCQSFVGSTCEPTRHLHGNKKEEEKNSEQ